MPISFPRFKVIVPHGDFSRRVLLGKQAAAERPAGKAAPYVEVDYRKAFIEPAAPRSAADFFHEYTRSGRFDEKLLEKFPLLAAFLEELRSSEAVVDLEVANILASHNAPEKVLCAGLVACRLLQRFQPEPYRYQRAGVLISARRLGLEEGRIGAAVEAVEGTIEQVRKALWVGLDSLQDKDVCGHYFANARIVVRSPETWDSRHLAAIVNLIRSLLTDRDARWLYAALKLREMSALGRQRVRQYHDQARLGQEEIKLNYAAADQRRQAHYFLQVLPVVEELGVNSLTEKIKDAFFMEVHPDKYVKIRQWVAYYFGPNDRLQLHLQNCARLVREVGNITGLLPPGAEVTGRLKSYYSIYEKMLDLQESDGRFPVLHDILALRALVTDRRDVYRVAYLMRRVFAGDTGPAPVTERPEDDELLTFLDESEMDADGDPRLDARLSFDPGFYVEGRLSGESRIRKPTIDFQRAIAAAQAPGGYLHRKGYRRGIKDGFGQMQPNKVSYLHLVLTTHANLPVEVQVSTFAEHRRAETERPHWEYKYLRQLKKAGLGKNLNMGDFHLDPDLVHVMIVDAAEGSLKIDVLPRAEARAGNFPGCKVFPVREWYVPDTGLSQLKHGQPFDPDEFSQIDRLENGYLLLKPGPDR